MDNPYNPWSPVMDARMFFGRQAEIDEISNFLHGKQSISIVGPNGIGKTSLVQHLIRIKTKESADLSGEYLFAYINCSAFCDCTCDDVLIYFGKEIANTLYINSLNPEPALSDVLSNPSWYAFEIALRKLNLRGLRLVFILDEFEQLTQNLKLEAPFYNALRSISSRLQVAYITCSTQPLIDLTRSNGSTSDLSSPFFNIFAQLYLGLLSEAEARQLIRKPMEAGGIVVIPQLEESIYSLVGGFPLAVQIACFNAWDCPEDLTKIEARTKQELEVIFYSCWQSLSLDERNLLHQPIEAELRSSRNPAFRSILSKLVRKCLLVQANDTYMYPSKSWADFVSVQPLI